MQIHPVRTEQEYRLARRRIEVLMDAAHGSADGDELDVLATLVDAYEARHYPMDAPDPLSAIEFRMDQQGMTRRDLEPLIGSRARVWEIMTGRRSLTLPMIRRLRDALGIPADLLITDSNSNGNEHALTKPARVNAREKPARKHPPARHDRSQRQARQAAAGIKPL